MNKEVYLDLMEEAVCSYTPQRIDDYIAKIESEGITEHGFARLTSNLGILIAHGRLVDKVDCFVKMMDLCVEWIPKAKQLNSSIGEIGNDFALKEISCCLVEVEASAILPKDKTDQWRENLSKLIARDIYSVQPRPNANRAYNWAVFGAASECARQYAGIGGDISYADLYLDDQLRWFDDDGRYQDPNQPEVYDFVTRLQYMAALHFGYDGPARTKIEEQLLRSAPISLMLQSVSGEFSYGGRSNQFLHNDTCLAAVFEYYATWMKQLGDMEMASRYKAAAVNARSSLNYWLGQKPVRHIKNRFPSDSRYGCERYAHFNKYMVTMGSWAYLAYLFADDSIEPSTKPEPASTYVTTEGFHRIMMNAGGYTVQFDLDAQNDYDSNGIGRFQKSGASPVVALSTPCPAATELHINTDIPNVGPLAIAPLWEKYVVVLAKPGRVVLSDGKDALWDVRLSKKGLHMVLTGNGKQTISIPALEFDGETYTQIECSNSVRGSELSVTFGDSQVCYRSNAAIRHCVGTYVSRSGHMRRYDLSADRKIVVDAVIRVM